MVTKKNPSTWAFGSASKHLFRDEEGATMLEYALVLGLILVVCVVAVGTVGTRVKAIFNTVNGTI